MVFLKVVELASWLHLLESELVNAYLLHADGAYALVDTGIAGSEGPILDALQSIGGRPEDLSHILVTHYHDDHRGSAAALAAATGAKVVAHALDAPVIAGEREQPPPNLTEEERPFADAVMPRVPKAPPCAVGLAVKDGDAAGPAGVFAFALPGHTPGSVAFHVPERRALFVGDVVASVGGRAILGPFNLDRAQAIASFRRVATLDLVVLGVGHGAPFLSDATKLVAAAAAHLRE